MRPRVTTGNRKTVSMTLTLASARLGDACRPRPVQRAVLERERTWCSLTGVHDVGSRIAAGIDSERDRMVALLAALVAPACSRHASTPNVVSPPLRTGQEFWPCHTDRRSS